MSSWKAKKPAKAKKKKSKIVEDPKVVRDLVSAVEENDYKGLVQILNDPVFSKLYDLVNGSAPEALVRACALGNLTAARTLLQMKADPNAFSGKAIHKACYHQQVNSIRLLMEFGADPNARSIWAEFTGLHFAAQGGNLEVVRRMVESGCSIDQRTHESRCRNENGWTALHFACDKGHFQVVRYLVERGSTIDSLSADGETPCSLAAEYGHADIVRYLVCNGADIHAKRRGLSLVQWAVYRADFKQVQYLVSFGADTDLNTRTLWFADDKPPMFGQWDFEDHDEAVDAHDKLSRIERKAAAEPIARQRIEEAARKRATDEFKNDMYETQELADKGLANSVQSAVVAALSAYDNVEEKQKREHAILQARATLAAKTKPEPEVR